MRELGELQELAGRAGSYAALRFSTDTSDPARGALLQRVQERGTAIETLLLFFELEWVAVPDGQAEELLADPRLAFCAHFLRMERRYRPHRLTQPEERILSEKSVTGRGAWARLFAELTSAIRVDVAPEDGEAGAVTLDVALARLLSPRRDVRGRRPHARARCA